MACVANKNSTNLVVIGHQVIIKPSLGNYVKEASKYVRKILGILDRISTVCAQNWQIFGPPCCCGTYLMEAPATHMYGCYDTVG